MADFPLAAGLVYSQSLPELFTRGPRPEQLLVGERMLDG